MKKYILLFICVLCVGRIKSAVAVRIEPVQCASPGEEVEVAISLENPSPGLEMGGFDLLFKYDTALTLQTVQMGQLLVDCEWEYFTFSQAVEYSVRIISIADLNNGPYHPSCYGGSSGALAKATFLISDQVSAGDFLPLWWMWFDCGDNTISTRSGDTLFLSDEVYDFDGTSYFVITGDTPLPAPNGAPGECLGGGGTVRALDFYNGGIHVTGDDTESPVAQCPGDIIVASDPGQCGTTVAFSATATDNCPGATVNCTPTSGAFFPSGTTSVACVAVDAAGNADTCTFIVTVVDTANPQAVCPTDTTVDNSPGQCWAVVTFNTSATDNCPGVAVAANPPSGSMFGVATTQVEVIATDVAGNTDTCTFTVTVGDVEAPVAGCPADIIVDNDPGQCGAVVTFDPVATDNCPLVTVLASPTSGSTFDIGVTPVEVVATDAFGYADTCYFSVTVNDTEAPAVSCPADTEVQNDVGEYGAVVSFDLSAADNCAGVSASADPPSGTLFPIGTTSVEVFAVDAVANADTCYFTVTVTLNDPDGDGRPNWDDNCPEDYNPDQADTDGDGIGDACCCIGIRGNANGDAADLVNIIDLTTLVRYLFRSGDIPPCPDEANVDGDSGGNVNIADLTYLVSYLFGDGQLPPDCPE